MSGPMDDNHRAYLVSKLLPWLKRATMQITPEWGPVRRVVLRHMKSDMSPGGDVCTSFFNVEDDGDTPSPDKIEETCDELVTAAQNDAEGMPRALIRYGVFCYYKRDPSATSRTILSLQGGKESDLLSEDGDGFGGEDPTSKAGHLAQAYRHVEGMMKMSMQLSQFTIGALREENQRLSTAHAKMAEAQVKNMGLVQQLMNADHDRQIASKEADMRLAAMSDLVDKAKLLAPHVVNKISGKNLLPTAQSEEEVALRSLVETMQPDQLDGLAAILSPEQMMVVMGLMEKIAGDGAQSHEEAQQGAQPNGEHKPS